MKRFYKAASSAPAERGRAILLDDRPVKTPARAELAVPNAALAEAILAEWNTQGEKIDPRSMPLTGLANAAIDRVAADPEAFAKGLALYGESDLLCYRAEGPEGLAARQRVSWDPLLGWARRRYDVDFTIVEGIMHRPQPGATVSRLRHAVSIYPPFELAALSPLVTISGSLIIGLALAGEAITLQAAWEAATTDEAYQAEQWGEDAEAAAALAARHAEFAAAHLMLELLRRP